jgi:hypothetical protein
MGMESANYLYRTRALTTALAADLLAKEMSDLAMINFDAQGFAHNYECRVLAQLSAGQAVTRSFGDPDDSPHQPLLVEVKLISGEVWYGSFRRVFDGCQEALLGCPNPDWVCVVAGGVAYAVAVADPADWRELPVVPTVTAAGYPTAGKLFLASFNVVSAFDSSMKSLWTTDLESHGIEFVGLGADVVEVRAYMPGFDDWVPRAISLTDGVASELKV